jgi:hypothetical protein
MIFVEIYFPLSETDEEEEETKETSCDQQGFSFVTEGRYYTVELKYAQSIFLLEAILALKRNRICHKVNGDLS